MRKFIIGFFRKCDILTMFSITTAFVGIILTIYSHFTLAMICLLVCGFCDSFDGRLARKYKYSKEQGVYGVELDSLSDAFAFGAFPAVFTSIYVHHPIAYIISTFYLLCGVIRLAYFNMLHHTTSGKSKGFIGVPITTVAITYPIFFILFRFINYNLLKYIMPIVLLLQGITFIVRVKIPKYDFPGLIIKTLKKVFNKNLVNFVYFPILLLLLGNLFFGAKEPGIINSFIRTFSHPRAFLMSFIWMECLCLLFYFALGNTKRGKIGLIVFTLIILFINDIKYVIMGNPLEASDINYLNPANMAMAGTATTTIGKWIWFVILKSVIYVLIGIAVIFADKFVHMKFKGVFKRIVVSIVTFVLFLIPLLSSAKINNFFLKKVYKMNQEKITEYSANAEFYIDYGFYGGLILNNASNAINQPEGYDLSLVLETLKDAENYKTKKYEKANIVFLLSESLVDVENFNEDISFNKDCLYNYRQLTKKDNVITFDTLVTATGGGSVNTEFPLLTGASLNFWRPGYIAYTQYYNDYNGSKAPNIIRELNDNKYTTMYLTPWGSSSFKSEYVYNAIGMDELYYNNDLNIKDDEIKGMYYSDDALVDDIYNELKDTKEGDYKFIVAASAENHYPFPKDKFDKYDIDVTSTILNNEQASIVKAFAQGVYDADKSIKKLYDLIQQIDTPTIILAYGDHYPYLQDSQGNEILLDILHDKYDNNLFEVKRRTTPAIIFANYDIEFDDLEYVNINYVGAYIINKLDLKIDPYFKYIDQIRKEVPVFDRNVYLPDVKDRDNYKYIKDSKKVSSIIDTYKYMQYYKFFDLGN